MKLWTYRPQPGLVVADEEPTFDYQSWCESESAESRRHALKRLDEATS